MPLWEGYTTFILLLKVKTIYNNCKKLHNIFNFFYRVGQPLWSIHTLHVWGARIHKSKNTRHKKASIWRIIYIKTIKESSKGGSKDQLNFYNQPCELPSMLRKLHVLLLISITLTSPPHSAVV